MATPDGTRLVAVAVPVPLGQAFTYALPEALAGVVTVGSRVLCPFGSRKLMGVVVALDVDPGDFPLDRIKSIAAVVDPVPVLPEELTSFLVSLANYYLAPVGEVMRLALPAVERTRKKALEAQGLLDGVAVSAVGKLVKFAVPCAASPDEPVLRGQQAAILAHLRDHGAEAVTVLNHRWGNARAAVRRLAELGRVTLEEREAERDPFFVADVERDVPPALNAAQAAAVAAIVAQVDAGERGAFLLDGVTASGKTEVYLRAVKQVLELGGAAIVLVPEIALTPQLVARFRSRLGDAIAVLHSGLSDPERHRMWRRLRDGELRVAIGARSALFAPVPSLRLICVDEEHDGSFKQEEGVRYHARDMAMLRAHRAGAVCVLGSATPSLASEGLVRADKMTRLILPARAKARAVLPNVQAIDLRRVGPGPSGDRLLSLPLHRAIEDVLAAGEQAILFLNRRGFSPSVVCEACGELFQCPDCSVALTLHRSRGERLRCHYCDYATPVPSTCPKCGSAHIAHEGIGTERVEALIRASFPSARVARLDRDVAAGLKSEAVIERVRRGEVDILVGTQMVTKGHDLPRVTLVGVLNADASLGMPDYQAAERTFQLLVQVAGRAGRGDAPGTVLVQTRSPDHPAIALALTHDVRSFVDIELGERRDVGYPPFRRLAMVRVDAVDEQLAARHAEELARLARRVATPDVDVLGPAPAPIARLRNRYRFRFLVRSEDRGALRAVLRALLPAKVDRRVRFSIDIDPVSML